MIVMYLSFKTHWTKVYLGGSIGKRFVFIFGILVFGDSKVPSSFCSRIFKPSFVMIKTGKTSIFAFVPIDWLEISFTHTALFLLFDGKNGALTTAITYLFTIFFKRHEYLYSTTEKWACFVFLLLKAVIISLRC